MEFLLETEPKGLSVDTRPGVVIIGGYRLNISDWEKAKAHIDAGLEAGKKAKNGSKKGTRADRG